MNMTAEEAIYWSDKGWIVGSYHPSYNPSRTAWMQWIHSGKQK